MEEIRTLRPEEVDQHLTLSQFAFQYEYSPDDLREAQSRARPENILGYFVDGQLAAQLVILPLTVYVAGVPVEMGGIAAVATWPEYRRGGKVAALLRTALERMRERGQVVSMLAPFSFAFYRKYGWEHCIDRKQYTIDRADWPSYPRGAGRMARTERWEDVAAVYEAYAARYSGMLRRSSEWWQTRVVKFKPGVIAVYYDAHNEPRGYLIYRVRQSEMTIHEWVALDEEARRALWHFVGMHDSMANKVTLVVPADDPLPFLLANPRIKQELVPYFMARVVDAAGLLRGYPFSATPAPLQVRLSDPVASWNTGVYTVQTAEVAPERRVEMTADAEPAPGTAHVTCDIQTFTAMMFGYQRPEQLARCGRLDGTPEAIALWEQAIPRQTPFLYDFF